MRGERRSSPWDAGESKAMPRDPHTSPSLPRWGRSRPPAPSGSPEHGSSDHFFVGPPSVLAAWLRNSWMKAWSGEGRAGMWIICLEK